MAETDARAAAGKRTARMRDHLTGIYSSRYGYSWRCGCGVGGYGFDDAVSATADAARHVKDALAEEPGSEG